MKESSDVLGRLRVASPCDASWDSMEGEGRVRFCRLCSLNVYDFSGMTRAEVEALVLKTEGRLCGRLTRRADGTVLTKDCPVGLRAMRLRATRAAGACVAALLSVFTLASGQTKPKNLACSGGGEVSVERKKTESKTASLSGVVTDPNSAAVPNVKVVLKNESTKKEYAADTSDEGAFSIPVLPAGKYTLRTESFGFKPLVVEHFNLGEGEDVAVKALLGVDGDGVEMGVIVTDNNALDYEYGGRKTTFDSRTIQSLPLPPEDEE